MTSYNGQKTHNKSFGHLAINGHQLSQFLIKFRQKFKTELKQIEEEKRMTFITSFERDALLEGEREGSLRANRKAILKVLEIRFGQIPTSLAEKLNQIAQDDRLTNLLELAVTVSSVDSFVTRLDQNILSE